MACEFSPIYITQDPRQPQPGDKVTYSVHDDRLDRWFRPEVDTNLGAAIARMLDRMRL